MEFKIVIAIIAVLFLLAIPELMKLFSVSDYSHLRGKGLNADRMNLRDALRMQMVNYAGNPPLIHKLSVYVLGDNLYDESFYVESTAGQFLAECGVSISQTIDVGDPKKVTTFELWLFDTHDMTTTTKVLMSEHIFYDTFARQELSAEKGEPVLIEQGNGVKIDSSVLRLEARILDVSYIEDAMLPAKSYFQHVGIEIAVLEK
jgi:hypothetical protein